MFRNIPYLLHLRKQKEVVRVVHSSLQPPMCRVKEGLAPVASLLREKG